MEAYYVEKLEKELLDFGFEFKPICGEYILPAGALDCIEKFGFTVYIWKNVVALKDMNLEIRLSSIPIGFNTFNLILSIIQYDISKLKNDNINRS